MCKNRISITFGPIFIKNGHGHLEVKQVHALPIMLLNEHRMGFYILSTRFSFFLTRVYLVSIINYKLCHISLKYRCPHT